MKKRDVILIFLILTHCTSGTDQNVRNQDIFDEAKQLAFQDFTASPINFDGGIQSLLTAIDGQANNRENAYAATIEGVVTLPSRYGVAIGGLTTAETALLIEGCRNACSDPAHTTSGACTGASQVWGPNQIFARSFVLQDANAAILIVYGLEPPISDVTQNTSMKYILNSRKGDMAVFGDRMRISVTRVQKYGTGTNVQPIVTDFSSPVLVSTRNPVPYAMKTLAFTRASDLYLTRRIEGYIIAKPENYECLNGTDREFQFNYQKGYIGTLCAGASSYADANASCTGSKVPYKIQLSNNLGAGTLSGFDTGNSFSYNFALGAKVRLTGSVFVPQFNQAESTLSLMLDQKFQAESLR